MDLFSGHSGVYSETWPASGYDAIWTGVRASDVGAPHQRYRVFVAAHPEGDTWWIEQRPTYGHPAAQIETSDLGAEARIGKLLPTPTTQDTDEACPSQLNRNTIPLNTMVTLLPTPMASEGEKAAFAPRTDGGQEYLTNTIARLLPTPSVADVEGGRKSRSGERGDELLLNGLAAANRFGDYAPAIERWERALRPAPDPTEPNDRGGRRLSARFVEWMQGMPDGHVTSIGLTRVQQLRILGNIVVPQQAAHALRLMRDEEDD